MPTWISPNHTLEEFGGRPLTRDEKIDVFEARVEGWMLGPAERCLANDPNAGFAALSIMVNFFEMIAKCEDGYANTDKAGHYFRKGFRKVFPDLAKNAPATADAVLKNFYERIRCGLYHSGMTGAGVLISAEYDRPVRFSCDGNSLFVNPHRLPQALRNQLHRYVQELRNSANAELREKFERRFGFDAGKNQAGTSGTP